MALSRREFLENSMWATAAAAAAAGREASAAAGAGEGAKRVAAADKLRVAVIGCNGQGGSHIGEWLANPDSTLVAVCDLDPAAYKKHLGKFADKRKKDSSFKDPEYVADLRKLFERKDIDAVSIAVPNHWHALAAVWAMQAGKDVYVEKPASHNVREGRVMTQWARKLGRICQVGIQSRSMTGMRQTLEYIHSGKIGKVTLARALCYKPRKSIGKAGKPAPIPEGLDFDIWAGPAAKVIPVRSRLHYDWHWFWDTGNGDLGNQNPHELDKARWGLGKPKLPASSISYGGRLGYVDDAETANTQVTFFDYGDAALVSEVRGLDTKDFMGAKIGNIWTGTDGYVVSTNYNSGTVFDKDGKKVTSFAGGAYQAHFANFVKAVRSRKHTDLHLDIEEGHISSALAHLGNVSLRLGVKQTLGTAAPSEAVKTKDMAETWERFAAHLKDNGLADGKAEFLLGRTVKVDPETEQTPDAEAAKLFTREYRAPFTLPEPA